MIFFYEIGSKHLAGSAAYVKVGWLILNKIRNIKFLNNKSIKMENEEEALWAEYLY